MLNTACTDVSFEIVTRQLGAVPEHAPAQFTKLAPAGGVAVSTTVVPCANFAEHDPPPPQLIPERSLVTVPLLLRPTESVKVGENVAVTAVWPWTVVVQLVLLPNPEQAPVQPVNTLPLPAFAVSVTAVPPV